MSDEAELERIKEQYREAFRLVKRMMGWKDEKVDMWFKTENPHFGGAAPLTFFLNGRGHKVFSFIRAAEEENFPKG